MEKLKVECINWTYFKKVKLNWVKEKEAKLVKHSELGHMGPGN